MERMLYIMEKQNSAESMREMFWNSPFQKQTFKVDSVSQGLSQYYILKVNDFNQVARSPLEEWIYYMNTGDIPDSATAPGLDEARQRFETG